MKKCLTLYLVALVIVFTTGNLFAQATASSAVAGTVTDKSQAVVVGADVTATNIATGAVRNTTTNASGDYRFDLLPVGTYTVKISKTGFAAVVNKVELFVGRTATINAALSPGGAQEVVEVSAEAPLLDQTKTSVSQNITPSEVEQLPLLGRDVANLAYLAPGVKQANSYDPTKSRYAILSVNGETGRNVNVTVNGIDNKDNTVGGPVMQLPLEGVQEYVISTQRFSAANGRSEGAAINLITKSGTNDYHGSLFGYFRDQALNATDVKAQENGVKPPYSRQFFGGSIGGPIVKDKLFAFFALERQREHTSIPEDPAAFSELSLVTGLGAQPSAIIETPFFETRYNGRLDYKFSDHNSAYVSYSSQANNGLNDQSDQLGDLTGGNFTTNHLQVANFTLSSVLSNTLVNQFTFGYQYWNNLINSDVRAPYVTFTSGAWFGTNVNVPQQSYQQKWQWRDDLTKTAGNHTLKFGADVIWNPKLGGFFASNSTLEIDFAADPSCILGVPPNATTAGCGAAAYPLGFATPGAVSSMSASSGDPKFDMPGGTKQLGFYAQDDWKVTKRLTLNLGLRWDKDINLIGASAIQNSRTYLALKAIGSPYAARLPDDDNKDFSPRVGFAYDITGAGKHVVRGGFGLYYGNVFQNIPLFMIQQSNPTIYQGVFSISTPADIVPGTGLTLGQWQYGVSPLPTIPPPSSVLADGSTGRLMDPDYRNPVSEQFNVGYQWALNNATVFETEYVHVLGLHENKTININPIDPVTGERPLSAAFAAAGVPVLGRTMDEQSINRTRYDGLNFSLRRRMANHFSLIANYTLSRAMGWAVESGGPPGAADSSSFRNYPHDPRNIWDPLDFGATGNDERHHITLSGIVDMPWGFQVAPILQFGTGRPYDLNQGYDVLGIGSGYSRPLIVRNDAPNDLYAFPTKGDATAAQACLAAGDCHQVGYNTARGRKFFQTDLRITKNIKLGERRNLALMFQAFNLTNKTNYGNNLVYTATSGAIGTPSGYINPTSGSSIPRAFVGEFGFRFSF